jgi:hypothetical protein
VAASATLADQHLAGVASFFYLTHYIVSDRLLYYSQELPSAAQFSPMTDKEAVLAANEAFYRAFSNKGFIFFF